MENRNGLCTLLELQPALGTPESAGAMKQMIELRNRGFAPKTVGADKGYHAAEFVTGVREQKIAPHTARKDGQKTLHVLLTLAHAISQKLRKRIEEILAGQKRRAGSARVATAASSAHTRRTSTSSPLGIWRAWRNSWAEGRRPPGLRCARTSRLGPKTMRAAPKPARNACCGAYFYSENHKNETWLYIKQRVFQQPAMSNCYLWKGSSHGISPQQ